VRRETEKRKKITESDQNKDQTLLLINEPKHIGEIKYKTLLAEKNLELFFCCIKEQTNKIASTTTRSPVRGTLVLFYDDFILIEHHRLSLYSA